MTVRELIAKLESLPEDQKDLPVAYSTVDTAPINALVNDAVVAAADYGQLIKLTPL